MIDCEVHVAPESWETLKPHLSPTWRQYVDRSGIPLDNAAYAYPLSERTSATAAARAYGDRPVPATYDELRERVLDGSDARNVVINCTTLLGPHRNPYYQAGAASAINDWIRTEWLDRDDRLRASLVVPWSDPDGIVAELERIGDDPRFVQLVLPIRTDTLWGKKANHRVFASASERGLAVALHAWGIGGKAATTTGFTTSYVENYLLNSSIVQQHLVSLVAEGALAKFPTLRVVLLECGFSWLPAMLWRMDKDWKALWQEIPWVQELPSHYVQRQVKATTAPAQLGDATPEQVRELVEMVGPSTLMYASDYPHDHGASGDRLLEALEPAARRAVLEENASTFYGLATS
jgi:predicted TIM-barrel fold metal-dependent hydrolase